MTALSILGIIPQPPVLKPQGEVIYQGRNLLSLREKELRKLRGGKIAMIFQDPSTALNPVYTIGDQLREVAEIHLDLYDEEADARAIASLVEVGLASPVGTLTRLPPPAFRGDETAGHDRHGAALRTRYFDCR